MLSVKESSSISKINLTVDLFALLSLRFCYFSEYAKIRFLRVQLVEIVFWYRPSGNIESSRTNIAEGIIYFWKHTLGRVSTSNIKKKKRILIFSLFFSYSSVFVYCSISRYFLSLWQRWTYYELRKHEFQAFSLAQASLSSPQRAFSQVFMWLFLLRVQKKIPEVPPSALPLPL